MSFTFVGCKAHTSPHSTNSQAGRASDDPSSSALLPHMDNYQGDLTDILRASGGALASSGGASFPENPTSEWQFPTSDPINFGDPFSNAQDPLLDMPGSSFFGCQDSINENTAGFGGGDMFSRMMVSPNFTMAVSSPRCESPVMATASPGGVKAPAVAPADMINAHSSRGCLIENTGLQISSPRNPGIKRRKSQAKKVVCIPAPAAVNGRPGGEVVPSDLWAWRKYGQKPIKGSPYPRGYYRCSSSKGCSARKQVERSRTDPNMLVITYTSEHNHPWPTQRNALAGSTRSQASKSNANSKSSSSTQNTVTMKEEQKYGNNDNVSPTIGGSSTTGASVQEESEETEKQLEMDDGEFGEGFGHSYRPAMVGSNYAEDFFADLGELEGDPLDLIFSQGFNGDEQKESKTMDPFSLFDWSEENHSHNDSNNASFGDS